MSLRKSTRRLLWRSAVGFFLVQLSAVASLMAGDKIRKIRRGSNVTPLPAAAPVEHDLAGEIGLTTYTYGATLFDDMISAIESATTRVLLESYIIKNDTTGRAFKKALIDASQRGVDVYVIYDGFANLVVRRDFYDFPEAVKVFRYPLWNAGFKIFSPRLQGRDHRKILVVDDTVGFVGGYNIGALYATQWRDTHLKVTGPAVWDLENAFVDFWNMTREPGTPDIQPLMVAGWEPQIRAHRNVPRQLIYPIRGMYLEAIDRAHISIDITAAYFIPDHDILSALLDAAQRGVRVRILTPKVSNHVVTDWLSRGFYNQLLRGGVEIHRYTGHMVHAKTATIDGEWSTIGTANIDRLSLLGNYEINLEVLDDGFAAGMQQVFETDLAKAERLTREEWESREWLAKVYEAILRPLGPLL